MTAYLRGISIALPERVQSNAELCEGVPGWTPDKIVNKTGILSRRVAADDETASDLAVAAAERLFEETGFDRGAVDGLIFSSQAPDYFLPATACVIQHRLQLPTTCAAFDMSQGCSGYNYGLWVARALIAAGDAQNILFLTSETYTKFCDRSDLAVASLFGDGAAATLVSADSAGALAVIHRSCCGTDGQGAQHIVIPGGCTRNPMPTPDFPRRMLMNGAAVASFAVGTVKGGIERLLNTVDRRWDDIDRFLFHQANPGFVKRLTMALHLPPEKVPIDLADVGNTGSATIPMLIRRLLDRNEIPAGSKCVMAGFGTGFSWGMTYAEWL